MTKKRGRRRGPTSAPSTAASSQADGKPGSSGSAVFIGALRVDPAAGSLQVDPSRLSAPDVVYDADHAWVEHAIGSLTFVFAKESRESGTGLRSRLEVRYPPERALRTFWQNADQFLPKVERYIAEWPTEASADRQIDVNRHAQQVHSQWASFSHLSFSGTEASIDFYHLSTNALAELAKRGGTNQLRLAPVVRIQLSTFELCRLMHRFGAVLPDLQRSLPTHEEASPSPSPEQSPSTEQSPAPESKYGS